MNKWLELKLEEKPRIFMFLLAMLLGVAYLAQKHFAQAIPSFPLEVFPQLVYGVGFWACVIAFILLLFLKQGPDALPIAIGFFTITIMETLTVITFIAWSYVYPWLGIVGSIVLGIILMIKKRQIRGFLLGATLLVIALIVGLNDMGDRWFNLLFAIASVFIAFPVVRQDSVPLTVKNLIISLIAWIILITGFIHFLAFIASLFGGTL